jgi:hypothetical protein
MTPMAWKMPSLMTKRLNVLIEPLDSLGARAPSKTTVRTIIPMLMSASVLALASYITTSLAPIPKHQRRTEVLTLAMSLYNANG